MIGENSFRHPGQDPGFRGLSARAPFGTGRAPSFAPTTYRYEAHTADDAPKSMLIGATKSVIGGLSSSLTTWEAILAAMEGFCGVVVIVASAAYLASFTRATGLLVGTLLVGLGTLGWAGVRRSSSRLLTLYAIGAVVCLLMTFNFVSMVRRDVEVDCAIAGLWVRAEDMEAQVRREAHTEMVSQLMARLGELEDSLELVHSGAVKAAELYSQREQLKVSDRSYIKAKLARLKKHAEDVVEDMLGSDTGIADMTPGERQQLIDRFSRAEELLARIEDAHGSPTEDLTAEEYQSLLALLSGLHEENVKGDAADPELRRRRQETSTELAMAQHELNSVTATLQRHAGGDYSAAGAGIETELGSAAQGMRARRKRWEQRLRGYMNDIKRQEAAAGGVMEALGSMPEHCVKELQVQGTLLWTSAAVLVVELVSAYGVLSTVVGSAVKKRSAD